jgi:hypothetical protein
MARESPCDRLGLECSASGRSQVAIDLGFVESKRALRFVVQFLLRVSAGIATLIGTPDMKRARFALAYQGKWKVKSARTKCRQIRRRMTVAQELPV